jgi:histidine triad (HIT) family protein
MDCIFCKIINKDIPSYTVYEDNVVKVFLDINPTSNGHMLIVPKTHYKDIEDIDLEVLNYINKIKKDMYKLLVSKLNVDGVTISQNNGLGQDIKHFHIHLIPRYKENELKNVKEIYNTLKDEK